MGRLARTSGFGSPGAASPASDKRQLSAVAPSRRADVLQYRSSSGGSRTAFRAKAVGSSQTRAVSAAPCHATARHRRGARRRSGGGGANAAGARPPKFAATEGGGFVGPRDDGRAGPPP